ncbi:MAG: Prolyl tripeptidyl peptidase precursor, partial [Planctomycetota bacterium]
MHNTLPFRRTSLVKAIFLLQVFTVVATKAAFAQSATDSTWQTFAEPRLKSIYDRGDFRPKNVQPKWLSDNSGFLIGDTDQSSKKRMTWFYDAKTGERRSATEDEVSANSTVEQRSIDGEFELKASDGKLSSVNRENKTEITLASSTNDREVDFRNPIWSPDGSKVLFVEADYTDVLKRWVLVPGDPSYPEVQQIRFARVGGVIEKLRVGVVNKDGQQVTWLPVDCPEEGMYLGQIQWAGNSQEVLVERFSRFRDRRDFLLINVDGEAKTIFSESDKAWVEASQGWNSGLVWIADGKEFIVISEKDGWRHAYRYSRDGEELAILTPGDYDIIERAVVDEDQGWYYFYASPQDGTQRYLYRVPLNGSGKANRLSPESQIGTHKYSFSPDT